MKYFIFLILLAITWLIATSLYMYDIKNDGHNHSDVSSPRFENVVVDVKHSFLGLDPDQVVCYRESHRNFYIFTLILMSCIIGLVAHGFVVKSSLSRSMERKNGEIQTQKSQIEQSNNNLISSLHYASKVQRAFLPNQTSFSEMFSSHFVLNLPRDFVSGDFYWTGKAGTKTVVCVGDCTGHGVPAALLTMNAFNILNQLVPLFADRPGELMAAIHQQLISNLDLENEEVTDGMDLSLLVFDESRSMLELVSAHQSIFVYNQGRLSEWKGDRRGLGPAYKEIDKEFSVFSIEIKKGTIIYAFSDGITDQFGGPLNKKFSKRRFQEVIHSVANLPLAGQKQTISETLAEWKAGHPQTDDILVLAVQV